MTATRWILGFDGGCGTCTNLARQIEALSEGRLTARNLREPEVQTLLDRARPGWRWEPTLLETTNARVRVFTGPALRAKLLAGLGPRRMWRIAQVVGHAGVPLVGVDLGRRRFLQRGATLVAGVTGLAIFGATPPSPLPQTATRNRCRSAC